MSIGEGGNYRILDPSIYIDGPVIHITYIRTHIAIEEYSLIHLTYDGMAVGIETILGSPGPITNAQMISGQTSGENLLAFTYAAAGGVYCIWQIGGESLSTPALISTPNVVGDMPDFIIDVQSSGSPDAYLHFVWCERLDELDNWEVFYRRGYIEYS